MTAELLDPVHIVIRAFRDRIAAGSKGFVLSKTASCPRDSATGDFVEGYTFELNDLLSRFDRQVIVHHGALPKHLVKRFHLLYNASPIVYAHRALGAINLSSAQVRDILDERITDWRTVHCIGGPIRLFCHMGEVHKSVFDTIAVHLFGARLLRSNIAGLESYEELAARASNCDRCLVFGLRPEYAPSDLLPISIDRKWPGAPVQPNTYPSLPVWISVPDKYSTTDLIRYL